jgi:hypothetical protein
MNHPGQRSTAILLTSLLLLAQLLLAWHLPSHINVNVNVVTTDSQADSTALPHISGEPCALGINGHGAALPASISYTAFTPSAALSYRTVLIHYHSLAYISYQARGPPLHS